MDRPRIVTHHERPPIPTTAFDWVAYRDGEEELGGYGYGPTEEAAIADLLANEADADEDEAAIQRGRHDLPRPDDTKKTT